MAHQEPRAERGNAPRRRRAAPTLAALVDDWVTSVEQGFAGPEDDLLGFEGTASPSRQRAAEAPARRPERIGPRIEAAAAGEAPVSGATGAASLPSPLTRPADGSTPTAESQLAAAGPPAAEDDTVQAALGSLRVAGGLVTFADAFGGRVALRRVGPGLRHTGGVAVRGPAAPPTAAFVERAPSPVAGRAFEFVASWFGSPFDAANLRLRHGSVLSWGFWDFSGSGLARVLAESRSRSPDLFAALIGRYGIDVARVGSKDGEDPEAEGDPAAWELVVRDDRRVLARGRAAARLLSADVRRLAALARAGREPGTQLSQIETALREAVLPALALPWPGPAGIVSAAAALPSARAQAALFFLVLRFGLLGTRRLVRVAIATEEGGPPEVSTLQALARALRRAGEAEPAQRLLGILASPELDD